MAKEKVLAEIDSVLAEYKAAEGRHGFQTWGSDSSSEFNRLTALLMSAIDRISPPRSAYPSQAEAAFEREPAQGGSDVIRSLEEVLQAVRADYVADRIKTFLELVHFNLFADMLDAAEYLLGESYKNPAAVMPGTALNSIFGNCAESRVST